MKAGRTTTGKTWHGVGEDDLTTLCGRTIRYRTRSDRAAMVDCQRCLKVLGIVADRRPLAPVEEYAKREGWHFALRTEQVAGTNYARRMFKTDGKCVSEFRFGRLTRTNVQVSVAPGYERFGLIAGCHELGHAEAYALGGWEVTRVAKVILEVDAWERGLRIAGELGVPIGPEEADFALACLASYSVTSGDLVDYLWELAE